MNRYLIDVELDIAEASQERIDAIVAALNLDRWDVREAGVRHVVLSMVMRTDNIGEASRLVLDAVEQHAVPGRVDVRVKEDGAATISVAAGA